MHKECRLCLSVVIILIMNSGCHIKLSQDALEPTKIIKSEKSLASLYPLDISAKCDFIGDDIPAEIPQIIDVLKATPNYDGNIVYVEILGGYLNPLFAKIKTKRNVFFLTKYNFCRKWTLLHKADFDVPVGVYEVDFNE